MLLKVWDDLNWGFIFRIFHHFCQFLAHFFSIFWLVQYQNNVLGIFWYQWDTTSHLPYPQRLFGSLLNGLKRGKIDSNWCFIFCISHHLHQFLAQFGSIFWLELYQYLTFVISWHQFDIPSYPTYPQKLFCSLFNHLKTA